VKQCLIETWSRIQQSVIDQWWDSDNSCVNVKGKHFEPIIIVNLSWLVLWLRTHWLTLRFSRQCCRRGRQFCCHFVPNVPDICLLTNNYHNWTFISVIAQVAYNKGARFSVPLAIQKKIAPHWDLKSGNCNNVETTLDGCSDRHTVWKEDSLDTGYIIMGTHGHGDLGWVLSCQVTTLVETGL